MEKKKRKKRERERERGEGRWRREEILHKGESAMKREQRGLKMLVLKTGVTQPQAKKC